MHPEEQAKRLWCPMVRLGSSIEPGFGINRDWGAEDDPRDGTMCVASKCAMWRWSKQQPSGIVYGTSGIPRDARAVGFCGLAGKPEVA